MTSRRSLAFAVSLALLALTSCGKDKSTNPTAVVASVDVTAPATFLAIGGTLQLTGTPRDAADAPVAADVTWSTSDGSVATVDQSGLVSGASLGDVRITASAGAKSGSIDLSVRAIGANLSGRIEAARITLESGLEYHATGDLALVADSVLRIDGTLIVDDGATVSIGSYDSTIVTGNIVPADTLALPALARGRSPWRATHRIAKDFTLWGGKVFVGRGSGNSEIFAKGNVQIGGIVPPVGSTEVILDGAYIVGGAGALGTKANPTGGNGSHIEIGTEAAQVAAAAAANRPATSFEYVGLRGSVTMIGGKGGDGFSILTRADASAANNTLTATAGNGGNGGSVHIAGSEVSYINATSLELRGGSGGQGGWVALSQSPDLILDGTGPNGEGESLNGTTGSGNQGGDVTITTGFLTAGGSPTIRGGAGGGPGTFLAKGGNGRGGGEGGRFNARIGIRGSGGAAIVGGNTLPPPLDPPLAIVRVEIAMNGGPATSASIPGGDGGLFDVADATGMSAAYTQPVIVVGSQNGGPGYDGCQTQPQTNGTDGGDAGKYMAHGVALASADLSYNGGLGGDGTKTGFGGQSGLNIDTGLPIGLRGLNGQLCPQTLLITANQTALAFTHIVGASPCPQLFATVTITNVSGQQISVTPTVQNTPAIYYNTQSFALGPGEMRAVGVLYDCTPPFLSFDATVRFVANPGANEQIIDIPLAATIIMPG